ncbi:MAG: class I SAM-dependent methyltransferase [Bdellovibrionia bacterium]
MLREISLFRQISKDHGFDVAVLRTKSKMLSIFKKLGINNYESKPQSWILLKSGDGSKTFSNYPNWNYVIPLPPRSLMFSIGAPNVESFFVVADAWAQVINRFLPSNSTVLDIGCGCGRIARILTHNSKIKEYIGFDVMQENIDWCKNFITPNTQGRFKFLCFDLFSKEYNPSGKIKSSEFRFPAADNSIDLCFAASLFTHILEPDTCRYLSEIKRVLNVASGIAVISIHIWPLPGMRYSGIEGKVDIAPDYFQELVEKYGLKIHERVGDVCGQEVFVLKSAN